VLVCVLSEGVAAFGRVLHSPTFLVVAALYELGKVLLAKILSGHAGVLAIPWAPPFDRYFATRRFASAKNVVILFSITILFYSKMDGPDTENLPN
jgi:hypothetical protein